MSSNCGVGIAKGLEKTGRYELFGGAANVVAPGYTKGVGLAAEIVGTFVLVYTVFSATDAKRSARDSHVPVSSNSFSFLLSLSLPQNIYTYTYTCTYV